MSGVVDKMKAKVDQVLHKDNTHDTTGTHTTGTHTTGTGVGGTTGSHTGVGGTTGSHTGVGGTTGTHTGVGGTTGTHSGYSDSTGPHDSRAANKADPRVDSDRYGAAGNTSGAGGVGAGQYGSTHTGTHGTTGSGLTGHSTTGTHGTTGGIGGNNRSDPTGPHDSHLANKLDPRVDSDRYGAAGNTSGAGGVGAGQYGSSTHTGTHGTTGSGLTGTHGTTGSGLTGTHGTHGTTGGIGSNTYGSDPTGPHDGRLGNKADPRVDSDRYGAAGNTSGAGGVGAGQYTEGYGNSAGTAGGIGGTSGGLGGAGTYNDGTHGAHGTHGTHGKPSLGDKLNPKKDADGDGKAGFMS